MNTINKLFNLKDKTVILTGSAGRLGSKFAHALTDAGANVVLVDIDEQKNSELEKSIIEKYWSDDNHSHPFLTTNPMLSTTDIANESEVKKMVEVTLKKYGKIDVLVNNAHFVPREDPKRDAPFEEYPLELWDNATRINTRSLFLCCQEVGRAMRKQSTNGVIVNISSIYGMQGSDQRIYGKSRVNSPPFYALTKGGMINFTRYLAAYWNRKNIRVNTLSLGGVIDAKLHDDEFIKKYSEKTMIGRMANTDDYNGALLFLCSDASAYMTGSNLIIDGGWSAW
jgi:NAD(P)-dependent dehydrogenase (short-subunit alcohol dehydrogenase family)